MKHLIWLGSVAALAGMLAAGQAMAQTAKPAPVFVKPAIASPLVRIPQTASPLTAARPLANCSPYGSSLAQGEALNLQGKFDDSLAIAEE